MRRNVRNGSKTALGKSAGHFRSAPISGPLRRSLALRIGAISRSKPSSLDHFVGAGEEPWRYSHVESLCRFEVDCQPKLAWKFDGKIARVCPPKDLVHEIAGATIAPAQVNAIAHKAAVDNVLAISEDGRQQLFKGDSTDLLAHVEQQVRLKDNGDIDPFVRQRSERIRNVLRRTGIGFDHAEAQSPTSCPQIPDLRRTLGIVHVDEQSDAPCLRHDFSREFNLLGRQTRDVGLNARYISSWASFAGNQAEMDRIGKRGQTIGIVDVAFRAATASSVAGAAMISGLSRATISSIDGTRSRKMSSSPNDIDVTALLVTELREPLNKIAERRVHHELGHLHLLRCSPAHAMSGRFRTDCALEP